MDISGQHFTKQPPHSTTIKWSSQHPIEVDKDPHKLLGHLNF